MLKRRQFNQLVMMAGLVAAPLSALATIIGKAAPLSPFGKNSTAEEVTAGIDLSGKTVVITGANSGLGYETMRVLAARGAHVIGTARSMEKAEAACASVAGKTTPMVLELDDFDSVVACADAITALNTPVDILICNAGIMALQELEQVYGLEKQFVVNHLGHFIFTNRLLPRVREAQQGRIVVLSSSAHSSAPEGGIEFDNLSGEMGYEPFKAYAQSKLANALFARELAYRLRETPVTANSVHPGVINTNLGRHFSEFIQSVAKLVGWIFMKSVEEGAATTCYVAAIPALAGVTGYYFADCNPDPEASPLIEDRALAERLWQVSEELAADYLA